MRGLDWGGGWGWVREVGLDQEVDTDSFFLGAESRTRSLAVPFGCTRGTAHSTWGRGRGAKTSLLAQRGCGLVTQPSPGVHGLHTPPATWSVSSVWADPIDHGQQVWLHWGSPWELRWYLDSPMTLPGPLAPCVVLLGCPGNRFCHWVSLPTPLLSWCSYFGLRLRFLLLFVCLF